MRTGLVGILAVVAMGLLASLVMQADAQTTPKPAFAAPDGVFVSAGRISGETYGLYLVDTTNKTICVYQVDPRAKADKFRLMAARTYAYDVRLDELNTTPSPQEMQRLVEQHRRLKEK